MASFPNSWFAIRQVQPLPSISYQRDLWLGPPVSANQLVTFLTLSLNTSAVLQQWKFAPACPVKKLATGTQKTHSDFGPISVIPILARIVDSSETVAYSHARVHDIHVPTCLGPWLCWVVGCAQIRRVCWGYCVRCWGCSAPYTCISRYMYRHQLKRIYRWSCPSKT